MSMAAEPLAYLNGRVLPQREAALPLHDAGFIFGATVTDLCRTFHRLPYRLHEHLDRFRHSCRAARIPQPMSDGELATIAASLLANNASLLQAGQELALVMFATPGPVGYYAGLAGGAGDGPPTLGMHTFPLPFPRYRRMFLEGAHLVIPRIRQVSETSVDPAIKQRSRLHWWLADREAQAAEPGAAALLLDTAGHVTETAAANFLIVRGGTVATPTRKSVLNGVSLQVVEELCVQLGIRFVEKDLTAGDCVGAEEAMVCSTSFCLAGVARINGVAVPWPGPVFQRLLAAWSGQVGLDIRAQILADG